MATTNTYGRPASKDHEHDTIYEQRVVKTVEPFRPASSIETGRNVLYYLLDILEGLLAMRFVLLLFNANPINPFVNLIYSVTRPFVAPFHGIFPVANSSGYVFEWATVIAMITYVLIVYAVVELFRLARQ